MCARRSAVFSATADKAGRVRNARRDTHLRTVGGALRAGMRFFRRAAPIHAMTIVFDNEALLPTAWSNPGPARALRIFNPALLRDRDGWLFAYRVVAEPELMRRLALCRLDANFRVIAGSQRPLSDQISFLTPNAYVPQARTWFADPRLYRLQDRLFLYWNSGWHEPGNAQFLQELDATTFAPLGAPRELMLRGPRQKLEKNWMLFESDGVFAVYSVNPHRVLTVSLAGDGPIECQDTAPPVANSGGFAQVHGGLRGGAPPQKYGGHFYSFCHSIENGPAGYEYAPSVYRFHARVPFHPSDMPRSPLRLDIPRNARRALPKLNPAVADVVYPAGAAFVDGKWALSFGVDDERCAIALLEHSAVVETLASAGQASTH